MTDRHGMSAAEPPALETAWLDRWAGWILQHRALVLVLIAVVTAASVVLGLRAPYRGSMVEAFMYDLSEYNAYRVHCQEFGGNADDLVFVATEEGDDLFTAEKLNAVRAAAAELAQRPDIERVLCLPDAAYVPTGRLTTRQIATRAAARRKLLEGSLDVSSLDLEATPYWPVEPARQATIDLPELRKRALADPMLVGTFLTADGRGQGMIIRLKSAFAIPLSKQRAVEQQIVAVLQRHGLGRDEVHAAGVLIGQGWIFESLADAITLYLPLGSLILAVILWLMFERLGVVLVSATTAATAILWSIGFAALCFGELSILVAAAPLMILVIVTAETVFLTTAYRQEAAHGYSREAALRKVVREVGGACMLTGLTTFIGFASLASCGSPAMRDMSLTVAVGVAVGLFLSLTLVPILFSFLPPFPARAVERRHGWMHAIVRWIVGGCRHIALTWPKTVIGSGIVVMAVGIAIAWRMEIDPDIPKRFPYDHPLPRSMRYFNEHLSGSTYLELFVTGPAGRWTEPGAIRKLGEFERKLATMPDVRGVRSVSDLYRLTDRAIGYGNDEHLPPTSNAAETSLQLAAVVEADAVRTFVNADRGGVRVLVNLIPSGYIAISAVGDRIGAVARQAFPHDVRVEVLGSYPIVGSVVKKIVHNYFNGNWICSILIWLLIAWGLGSIRVGAWAMFPNLLPMALLGAMLVLTLDTLDSDLLIIPMTALGIAVDDTIHFIHRYRLGLEQTGDPERALNETFDYAGDAVLQTTVLLSAGLAPYAFSPFLSIWMLGTYMTYTLLFAVLSDLLLTPAMAKVGLFHWRNLPRPGRT